MEKLESVSSNSDVIYPVVIIPKTCTTLETNCDATDNIFMNLTITSPDIDGNEVCIYTGLCNIKMIDSCELADFGFDVYNHKDRNPTLDTGTTYPPYSQSQVWIDPARSPYVYNKCDTAESQDRYSVYQSNSSRITVEQHNTYITQNVYNCNEPMQYSPVDEFGNRRLRNIRKDSSNRNSLTDQILYEDDEFECGVILSKLPEEIWNENESRAREEIKYVGMQNDDNALKQLMSSDIQSLSKQQKTILFLGHDSHFGQTIQKIAMNDPYLQCAQPGDDFIGQTKLTRPNQKKYQCDKCKQIFDEIAEFKQHMVGNHKSHKLPAISKNTDVKFMCLECGKSLKNQKKFEMHCLGHGNPDLECNMCHKVFASKFTLRTHMKIHQRKYPCKYCSKTYSKLKDLQNHSVKLHFLHVCHECTFIGHTSNELKEHRKIHLEEALVLEDTPTLETDFDLVIRNDLISETLSIPDYSGNEIVDIGLRKQEEIARADSIIAKVISNKMFLQHSKKSKRNNKSKNKCEVCLKTFDRISDLKRHLIEHVIRSTLAKNPVSIHGTLNIICEICQTETFTKVDKYKAHLREHAKLTLYKCTFCDKSFSDSSNFSKHKKIHGVTFFQCDLCQRKFNSKKMLTQHMEYHNKNDPIPCYYCDKMFHFESMLNKHIKCSHTREVFSRFRCRFCYKYFKSLKDKWDHEWTVHKIRKTKIDCMICGAQFRKYSELKRHCSNLHDMELPPKNLYKKRSY